jgi:hypothetical protein
MSKDNMLRTARAANQNPVGGTGRRKEDWYAVRNHD